MSRMMCWGAMLLLLGALLPACRGEGGGPRVSEDRVVQALFEEGQVMVREVRELKARAAATDEQCRTARVLLVPDLRAEQHVEIAALLRELDQLCPPPPKVGSAAPGAPAQ